MQISNEYNIDKRTLFYWSKLYCGQIKAGDKYSELEKTITINILNFNFFDNSYHSVYHLREDTYRESILNNIEVHFIELPKFRKLKHNYDDTLENWLLFIDGCEKEELEMVKKKDPIIKVAEEARDYIMSDPEMQRLYELREKWSLDQRSGLYSAHEDGLKKGIEKGLKEGIKKGRAEGIKKGRAKGKVEVAKKLLKKGYNVADICEITGLDKKAFM